MKAKKIESGYYEYRGHYIERTGIGYIFWSITEKDEYYCEDYRDTLKFAKEYVDRKIAYQERSAK